MNYFSTRGMTREQSFKSAVMMGLAPDGGLMLPDSFPVINIDNLKGKSYQEIAFEIIRPFADIPADILKNLITESYKTFEGNIVPIISLKDFYLAELFHGPTCAFKDIALQFLGGLFERYLSDSEEQNLNIVGATSGDTGSAAIFGVRGKKNIKIAILYPNERISPVQERQMLSVYDENVRALAVDGSFDDCQKIVKELFNDIVFKQKYHLSTVNSINWARVLAQIVYYFYSYLKIGAKSVNFVVPTGNFGNIFAGYCAKRMGLPIAKLVLVTNSNNILHRFVSKGDYSIRPVKATHSPSMDIQLASNFERYLYYLYEKDSNRVNAAYAELKNSNQISFSKEDLAKIQEDFISCDVSDEEIELTIKNIYEKEQYILDPHTACAVYGAIKCKPGENNIILSTAHPAKFPEVVQKSIGAEIKVPLKLKCKNVANRINLENNTNTIKEYLRDFFS